MNPQRKGFGVYIILLFVLLGFASYQLGKLQNQAAPVQYSDVVSYFQQEQVQAFDVDQDQLHLKLKDGKVIEYRFAGDLGLSIFYGDLGKLIYEQKEKGILTTFNYQAPKPAWWMAFLPYLIMIGLLIAFWYFTTMRSGGGGGGNPMTFGRSRAKFADDNQKKIGFADVAGADEEKAELVEIVEFLKNPSKFTDMGARIPKGILLVGPPGTGKTLLAKAVAGEADVPFLSVSGSDFVELYVGVGASRVRDLFDQAKKHAPAIVFIDEIDAVGRQRGAGLGGGHDEREQTLNQLLVEMDGFGMNEGVIIMAATNRPDILDNALLRPGRFDRQIYVGAPDVKGREAVLAIHAKGKRFADDVKLSDIAKNTAGFTGADLENLLNEAALLAARNNETVIQQADIEKALLKVVMGVEKKSHIITEKDKKLTAYHEAGHALCFHLLPTQDPVHHVTIIPRSSGAGGFTMPIPMEDRSYYTRSRMKESLIVGLGGRVAEALVLGDISTGASGDIQQITDIARAMVTYYGMSQKIGPINYDSTSGEVFIGREFGAAKSYSEQKAAEIDEEIHRLIHEAYIACEKLLHTHMDALHRVAEYLIQNETMDGETFVKVFENKLDAPEGTDSEKPKEEPSTETAAE